MLEDISENRFPYERLSTAGNSIKQRWLNCRMRLLLSKVIQSIASAAWNEKSKVRKTCKITQSMSACIRRNGPKNARTKLWRDQDLYSCKELVADASASASTTHATHTHTHTEANWSVKSVLRQAAHRKRWSSVMMQF